MSGLEGALEQMTKGNFADMQATLDQIEKRMSGKGEAPQHFSGADEGARKAMAQALAAFASTPGGKMFLDEAVHTTLWRMVYPVGIYGMSNQEKTDFAAMREGQNGFVYQMLRLIAEGRGDNPPPQREVL